MARLPPMTTARSETFARYAELRVTGFKVFRAVSRNAQILTLIHFDRPDGSGIAIKGASEIEGIGCVASIGGDRANNPVAGIRVHLSKRGALVTIAAYTILHSSFA